MSVKRYMAAFIAAVIMLGLVSCESNSSGEGQQDYPSGDVTMLVGYAPGGATDSLARIFAEYMEGELDQPVLVENNDGGSGTVAMNEMINSEPDGQTLVFTSASQFIFGPLTNDVGYDHQSFAAVAQAAATPSLLVVPADSPYDSAEDLFQAARENPDSIQVGVSGANTGQAVDMRRLGEERGIELNVVPFDGGAPAVNALLGGNLDAVHAVLGEVQPNIEADNFRALATTAESPYVEDVPTFADLDVGFTPYTSYFGITAPEGTPDEVTGRLEEVVQGATQDAEVQRKMEQLQAQPAFLSSEEFRERINGDWEIYQPILGG